MTYLMTCLNIDFCMCTNMTQHDWIMMLSYNAQYVKTIFIYYKCLCLV